MQVPTVRACIAAILVLGGIALGREALSLRLVAIRRRHQIDWAELTNTCTDADIVVSDRRLPRGCNPRWLKLDWPTLEQSGGLAIYLGKESRVETVAERLGAHPWTN